MLAANKHSSAAWRIAPERAASQALAPATGSQAIPIALIADDQPDILSALRLLLKSQGYQTEAVTSAPAALEAIKNNKYDVVLMDLNYARDTTSGQEGLDLISSIRALDDTLPIIAMTAWGSIDLVVEAMQRGVRDFVLKPWDNKHLLNILRRQIESGYSGRELRRVETAREKVNQRFARELEEARQIQQELLPKNLPRLAGFDIAHAWRPAREVGGDYFDVMRLSDDFAMLCIADVEGKGMPAALLMSNLQAAVRACASEMTPPSKLCQRVNRIICENTAGHKFITFFYALVDTRGGRIVYTNAGHCAPILMKGRESFSFLKDGGAVLGVFPDWEYEQREIEFSPEDRLLLFTDGVTEARDGAGEEFGEDRLKNLLADNRDLDSTRLNRKIVDSVMTFSGGTLEDDMTLIVLSGGK